MLIAFGETGACAEGGAMVGVVDAAVRKTKAEVPVAATLPKDMPWPLDWPGLGIVL